MLHFLNSERYKPYYPSLATSTPSKCHRRPSSKASLAILEFWLKGGGGGGGGLEDFGDKGGGGDREWSITKNAGGM